MKNPLAADLNIMFWRGRPECGDSVYLSLEEADCQSAAGFWKRSCRPATALNLNASAVVLSRDA